MKRMLTISKLDAARRQLETAIRLYFSTGDPVSIHTLSAAAYNVIRDINKKRGGSPLIMKDQFLERVKDEHKEEARRKLNEAENFFKHANRDHKSTLEFNPEQSEALLLEACSVYYALSAEFPPLFKLFQLWFVANHPTWFKFPQEEERLLSINRNEIVEAGRERYFQMALPFLSKIRQ
jgi:hypothetical protein